MDQFAITVSSFVHNLENLRLPVIPYNTYVKTVCIGIPIAVFLHDTSKYWIPKSFNLPIITWFRRRWLQEPDVKLTHLRIIRDFLLFAFFIVLRMDSIANDEVQPSDYVEQRLISSTAQHSLSEEIYKARQNAFSAADELLGEVEMNMAGVQQQREAALRRRYLHDSRLSK
ncbi:unnamed protein product [Phytomonas sp. Hart1]|nr:unnamed protein product [Phytomonas sp. Hart1]|eukprot:CCW68933.1 unnamed protein product [Phytomonas sp. isolate Hart1]